MLQPPASQDDQARFDATEALAQKLENLFLERFGVVLSGEAIEKALGYSSQAALRKAMELGHLPVPVFRIPHRRGRFVLASDLAHWLSKQSRTSQQQPPIAECIDLTDGEKPM